MNGCIFKRRLKSGIAWGYSFFAGRDPNGKRIQIFKSGFKTKSEASTAVREAIAEHERTHGKVTQHRGILGTVSFGYIFGAEQKTGLADQATAETALAETIARCAAAEHPADVDPTFAEYIRHWLDEHARRRLAPKTFQTYEDFSAYLIRRLGETRLNDLGTAQIQRVVHELSDCGGMVTKDHPNGRPLAPKTVRHIAMLLYTCLAEADRLGVLKIPHPMRNRRVKLPKLPKRKPAVLDRQKLSALFDRSQSTRTFPFIVLAAATGCRRGELLALQWSDLNENTGDLSVSKSLEQTRAGGLRVKGTKSGEPRQFVIPESVLSILSDHRAQQNGDKLLFGPDYRDHNLIFCQPNGAYYSPDKEGSRVKEMMRAVGLESVSLHSLRHSFASELLSKGTPIPVVSERLGHANPNITLSIYSHAIPADSRAAAKVWNDAMSDIIQSSRKPAAKRMLADACRTGTDGGTFADNKGGLMVGATGLEPDKPKPEE